MMCGESQYEIWLVCDNFFVFLSVPAFADSGWITYGKVLELSPNSDFCNRVKQRWQRTQVDVEMIIGFIRIIYQTVPAKCMPPY